MSKALADMDGIKYEYVDIYNTGYGKIFYHVKCGHCGAEILRQNYGRGSKYSCEACKLKLSQIKKPVELTPIGEVERSNKSDMRMANAVKCIEKQGYSIKAREKAIKAAMSRKERYGSIPEAVMAIELLHNGYRIIPQQRIGGYKVDFCLPEQKMVIEVDGSIYHSDMDKEAERDFNIMCILGREWKIVRIPAEIVTSKLSLAMAYFEKRLKWGTQGTA